MKNSNYQSVPVLASVIGSKTRKAMYLVNITSMDGEKVYKDKWVPVQWGDGVTIDWTYYSTSELVEFPLKNKSEVMIIESPCQHKIIKATMDIMNWLCFALS